MRRTKSIEIATALLLWVLFLYLQVPASPHAGSGFYTSDLQQDDESTGFILFETEQKKATGSSESSSLDLFCDAVNQAILL